MSSFDAVIFDMDGVIFDSEKLVLRCWKELAERHNIPDIETTCRKCIGLNRHAAAQIFLDRYGEDFPYYPYKDEMSALFNEYSTREGLPVKEGAREILESLCEAKIPKAIASSSRRQYVTRELSRAGLLEKFEKVICGDMVEHSKPHPEIFLKAASELSVSPDRAIVIEDSFNGIRAAHAGGFRPVMVPDLLEPTEEIRSMTEVVLPSLLSVRDYLTQL